jgi:hypothetical protein
MTTQSLSKSAITKEAQKLLNDGIPKQEAYETLTKKYNNSKLVADIMMHLPSSIAKSKYRKWNILLLISIIISGVMFFVYAPSPLLLFEFVFFVVVISIMYTKLYIWVSALSIISLLVFIGVVIASSLSTIYLPISISVFVLTLFNSIFPFWVEKKLCPKPKQTKEIYTNTDGEQRQRIVYEFDY